MATTRLLQLCHDLSLQIELPFSSSAAYHPIFSSHQPIDTRACNPKLPRVNVNPARATSRPSARHLEQFYLHRTTQYQPRQQQTSMAMSLSAGAFRASIRRFSARPPKPETRGHRFLAASCIASAVALPFVPPALESSREKKSPTHQGQEYVFIHRCVHNPGMAFTNPSLLVLVIDTLPCASTLVNETP